MPCPSSELEGDHRICFDLIMSRHSPGTTQHIQEAIRTVRFRAAEFKFDPHRLGVMGFSAGGHLSATASVYFDTGNALAATALDRPSSRPDFAVLIYPLISMQDSITEPTSRGNLIGQSPSQAMKDSLSVDQHVTSRTPPTFLTHGSIDKTVPIENSQLYGQCVCRSFCCCAVLY